MVCAVARRRRFDDDAPFREPLAEDLALVLDVDFAFGGKLVLLYGGNVLESLRSECKFAADCVLQTC